MPAQPRELAVGDAHSWGLSAEAIDGQQQQQAATLGPVQNSGKGKGPDAIGLEDDNPNMEPPNLLWRVFAAFMYVIPWIDTLTLGREFFHTFPQMITLYLLPSPFVSIYYANNFMPLIVFFLCFLAIVKNTKLHHFVRFNTMQAIMLDIVVMLFNIIRAYFPAEIRWSVIMILFDKFAFLACMATVLYGIFFTLRGYYADIPFVSEAVYIQVEASEYA
eukprot:CAMPEP_0117666874 /NCGR_PEP_ID=MMETSP0804-20121206/10629_1 /TAXON_ID=1074897 /ORGANISM="Tetraselmis astigmatica, Strain CCMP880" /LENGTH=217 /DNA_ID=CAMNT_0005474489 /DNA_START=201 /DNA_END=855 /DNA_ORIENTATION=+